MKTSQNAVYMSITCLMPNYSDLISRESCFITFTIAVTYKAFWCRVRRVSELTCVAFYFGNYILCETCYMQLELDLKTRQTRRTCKTRLGKFRSSSSVICVLYVGRSNTGGLSLTSFTWITTIV